MKRLFAGLFFAALFSTQALYSQEHSYPQAWNEAVLEAIRNDFARPTVHARNLFHFSVALYDTWALFDDEATTYLIGKRVGNYSSSFDFSQLSSADESFVQEAASHAVYRLLNHRFEFSPGVVESQQYFDSLMNHWGYPTHIISTDYTDGRAVTLGNFIASEIIAYGLQDGSFEEFDYFSFYYFPVNQPLLVSEPGFPDLADPNRWQPLAFDVFIDQSGNEVPGNIPTFLSPEWGLVEGFTLNPSNATSVFERDGGTYYVHHDPGPPPYLTGEGVDPENYQWGFTLVSEWSSQLDPDDGVMWDISPASIGNISSFPETDEEYRQFYRQEGGDWGEGHDLNPATGQPYEAQMVPRGDYTRVLAEFWADGPDSETPPGHWFTILNYVINHPEFEYRYEGGDLIDETEFEIKAYFLLGAAMHDAAIAAWGIKGWYDYIRPISAIRYMANLGQSSDSNLPNYDPLGIPLKDGYVELIEEGDPIATQDNIGQIKLRAWRGPDFVEDPETDLAGVDWITADTWMPYQRPTFVTPPFAGYVSGHSTYSRAGAEILTSLTGDPFFPGGVGEFVAPQNEFLVFEEGPSIDVILEWATYRDASDQCSLSRIWGGIHPPADDIPGRRIGEVVGNEVFAQANEYFDGTAGNSALNVGLPEEGFIVYPNPVSENEFLSIKTNQTQQIQLIDNSGRLIRNIDVEKEASISLKGLNPGLYFLINGDQSRKVIIR